MEFSGCVESLFVREHPAVDDRIRACAAAGLAAVEFWLWHDKDLYLPRTIVRAACLAAMHLVHGTPEVMAQVHEA